MSLPQPPPSEQTTSVAAMSLQPPVEPQPLTPKKPAPPPPSVAQQVAPVIAVSVCAVVVTAASLLWVTSVTKPAPPPTPEEALVELAMQEAPPNESSLAQGLAFGATDPLRMLRIVRSVANHDIDAGLAPQLTPLQEMAAATRFGARESSGGPGLLVLGVNPSSRFATFGVHGGDRLLRINGFDLNERQHGDDLYRAANEARVLVLEFERAGRIRFTSGDVVASGERR